MYKPAILAGALFAGIAVITGAFGAHALKPIMTPDLLQSYETAVKYQFYHSFALLFCGVAHAHIPSKAIRVASWLFFVGILLFCSSIYALTLMKANGQIGISGLGAITPIGGMFFIFGWISVIWGIVRRY